MYDRTRLPRRGSVQIRRLCCHLRRTDASLVFCNPFSACCVLCHRNSDVCLPKCASAGHKRRFGWNDHRHLGRRDSHATVTATNSATAVKSSARTTSAGQYRISNLLPGNYPVSAGASVFSTTELRNAPVRLNQATTINMTLNLSAVILASSRSLPNSAGKFSITQG